VVACVKWCEMNEYHVKASSVLHMHQLKEDDGKLKQNAERYGVHEGSPVEVQWLVRWVGQDLWWEGFVEQVCFKSGMEERGSDGWCDGW